MEDIGTDTNIGGEIIPDCENCPYNPFRDDPED